MFNFSETKIDKLVIHKIGLKSDNQGVHLSNKELNIQYQFLNNSLLTYFLGSFQSNEIFHFSDINDVIENPTGYYCRRIIEDSIEFLERSCNLAELLYDKSDHPKIKAGEFYTVLFKNCIIEDEVVDALGLFKSENKDTFLKVEEGREIGLQALEGINIKKLDKGCLIFNTEKENGYKVLMLDNIKESGAEYWKNSFLGLKRRLDNVYHTSNMIKVCKEFCEDVLVQENGFSGADHAHILNNASQYFSNREKFVPQEFEREVMQAPQIIEDFRNYKQDYASRKEIPIPEDFDIIADVVNSEKKNFKTVLKLDKNFHVYIHGKQEFLEKGYDEQRGMHYYTMYFHTES